MDIVEVQKHISDTTLKEDLVECKKLIECIINYVNYLEFVNELYLKYICIVINRTKLNLDKTFNIIKFM